MHKNEVKLEIIDAQSPYLEAVIALGDSNKKTLSFFPKGAFQDHASRRQIIVAIDSNKKCVGYLLYGKAETCDRITLKHLCVAESHRGMGIAKKLVDLLKEETKEYSGIGLTCRTDYEVTEMWPKLGFVWSHDKKARTLGKTNAFWWLENKQLPLVYAATQKQLEKTLCVVIDKNIFFELASPEKLDKNADSKLLLTDWLQADVTICLVDEIFNDIRPIKSEQDKKNLRKLTENFIIIPSESSKVDSVLCDLKQITKDHSVLFSLRHLAKCIASESRLFITNQLQLVEGVTEKIYEKFKVSIITPQELIIKIDYLRQKPSYQPASIAGTNLIEKSVQASEIDLLVDSFYSSIEGQSKSEFQQLLLRYITEPARFECNVVSDKHNTPITLCIYDTNKNKSHEYELEIPVLRIADNILGKKLGNTLIRHILLKATSRSAFNNKMFTRITDCFLNDFVKIAIQEDNFTTVTNGLIKVNLAVAETAQKLSERLNFLASDLGEEYYFCHQLATGLKELASTMDGKLMLKMERYLWPAKIIDAPIPNFIIPIKPTWARELFDYDLANKYLLYNTTELAINREAVFYKSTKGGSQHLKPGVSGRILWYVSQDNDRGYSEHEVKCIRACSILDDVVFGKPKDLYQRFKNLGIYTLKDLMDIARNDENQDIMALKFSETEVFENPIQLDKVRQILQKDSETMQSLRYININAFHRIYSLGR
ncbi:GNAT family N-acetyltransferase [Laspinema sp. A4]|uniref:GNAT family N-acetyltransferase n=1 Tax=Laspinema sp. D2d TaxID=2953686 RepID=UPI0021BAE3FB|nr:GNAT family N-acetyltransferase [Laspinema sp. D2d]MCT7982155.1 GNAT family N-acetyltransferase [Laspinema sp. D2d]